MQDILVGSGLAPVPAVEHSHYLNTGGEVYAMMTGTAPPANPTGGGGVPHTRQPGRGRGRGGRGGGRPLGGASGGGAPPHDRVGRFPRDWKELVTATGDQICVAWRGWLQDRQSHS